MAPYHELSLLLFKLLLHDAQDNNQLTSISNGAFTGLRNLQILQLVSNAPDAIHRLPTCFMPA